ncbi:bifunctional metallophosphatase/5'-nucleotidase [Oxalicibacterium flavum]|uniref:Bifunctional metallophosphatase/5'-nucleotidase n=1 Tax=Oxalicibacterium flavum TaxID=179467 RepID=A0A8J2UN02_9BURK|nr:bifunctional metallophosphatase/5'-nucleotidase [Oxalicibacterium flavum]GGC10713.1 bifunctional metallophosphatase/5'-nucleotidase [Oxalicibacterium flavum]
MRSDPQPSCRRILHAVATLLAATLFVGTPAGAQSASTPAQAEEITVKIIAFNDLHGHLDPPQLAIRTQGPDGRSMRVPAGGAAYLADAIRTLKQHTPYHAVVSAGDLVGASPLLSALFLDEPTVLAANLFGLDFNAVGNHEFDRGAAELQRLQDGGCTQHISRPPCILDGHFQGARFGFLAANVFQRDGSTLFPAAGIKVFGPDARQVKIGFIGATLKGTPAIVTPAGVAGLRFGDEADAINAQIPQLRAQGVHAIVALIHQGGTTTGRQDADRQCLDLEGEIVPIIERLDPAIDVVVSGHTHRAYLCDYRRADGSNVLLTSAGQYGTLLTEIDLTVDTRNGTVVGRSARNVIVQSEPFTDADGAAVGLAASQPRFDKDPAVEALLQRTRIAAAPLAARLSGRLAAAITRRPADSGENSLGNLVADAHLAATHAADKGGAQIAFMNPGGLRADLIVPVGGGDVDYAQLFKAQPFGNHLVVLQLTGRQLKMLLEQQFAGRNRERPRVLLPSAGFTYRYDLSRPAGQRVSAMRLHGADIVPERTYRITVNNYLAAGGDGFGLLRGLAPVAEGMPDVDALDAYLRSHSPATPLAPPATDRIRRVH